MKSLQDTSAKTAHGHWPVTPGLASPHRLGGELKTVFDAGPLPDRLTQLADALDEAFRRGELTGGRRPS
jgi:hypothetical protein